MPKVTSTQVSLEEKPKSGIIVKIQPKKKAREMVFFMPKEGEKGDSFVVKDFNQKFMWLGHVNRYEGSKIDSEDSVYSTYFERNSDFCQLWEKKDGEKAVKIYEGKSGDSDLKEKSSFRGGKYSIHVFLINEKGSLCELILNGMNVGNYFDFVKEHGGEEYLEFTNQVQVENPQKTDEWLYLMDFKPLEEKDISFPENFDYQPIVDQLQIYIDYSLNYARTGSHDRVEIDKSEAKEMPTPQSVPESSLEPAATPIGTTNDDDLPF